MLDQSLLVRLRAAAGAKASGGTGGRGAGVTGQGPRRQIEPQARGGVRGQRRARRR
jgi:hypothetical protein